MKLVLSRIDDRLLHAQVALGWVGVLSPHIIIVADDEMAADERQIPLLRMGLPQAIELVVAGVQKAAKIIGASLDSRKCILLVRTPFQALEIVEAGVRPAEINVGGMHFREGTTKLLPYLYVDGRDARVFEELASRNVKLTAQDVPGNPSYDVLRLLRKVKFE